ncbi:MAG TPA: hypothetical protein VGR88_04775 [Ktedonobacterales bacterium]|nr:hypothetical protein [Ktedonobacterales bacterium]
MWTPPDAPSPQPSPQPSPPNVPIPPVEAALDVWRPPDWPTPAEAVVWARIQPPPHNGPANASLICGVVSLFTLVALAILTALFKTHAATGGAYLSAAIVVAEEGLVPAALAIYFGRLAHDDRYEPLMTDAGWSRSRLGQIFGVLSILAILIAGIATLVVAGQ